MLLAFTRSVSPEIARCELTHIARTRIDYARAVSEHDEYEDLLRRLGCRVERLPDAPELPDSVFVEDTAVVFDDGAVIARPGAASGPPGGGGVGGGGALAPAGSGRNGGGSRSVSPAGVDRAARHARRRGRAGHAGPRVRRA